MIRTAVFAVSALMVLVSGWPSLAGDDPDIPMSLDEALKLAAEQNLDLKVASAQVDAAIANKNKTNSVFLPKITLSETYISTNDPLNVFGFKLKQEIVTSPDFDPGVLNDPDRFDNFTTRIEVIQPVFNLDGFYGRAAASSIATAQETGKSRTGFHVAFQVKKTYTRLSLTLKSLEVIRQAKIVAEKNRDQAQHLHDQGLTTRSDVLLAEVRLLDLEAQEVETQNRAHSISNHLKLLLNLDTEGVIVPVDSLEKIAEPGGTPDLVKAIDERSDVKGLAATARAAKSAVRMNQFKFVPNLNAFASAEMNDETAFGSNGRNWTIGGTLSWNLFDAFQNIGAIRESKALHRKASLELEKARMQQRMELESMLKQLDAERKKTALAEKALQQATESFRIVQNRYDKGLEKTTDLLQAELLSAKSRLEYYEQVYRYNVTVFTIEFLMEEHLPQSDQGVN